MYPVNNKERKDMRVGIWALKIGLMVSLCATVFMAVGAFLWISWRLGPGGYNAHDAQNDRDRICQMIELLHPDHGEVCPKILIPR